MFRSHPAKGKRIIEPIPFMRDIVPGCYCHHQAWDGSGYAQGLIADNIRSSAASWPSPTPTTP
jgi:HD-GYP domain-containing protein (c-di-GMP phosphodiesterase class II)